MASLKTVDKAILGHENMDMLGVLKETKPDIISVGYDQQAIKKSLLRLLKREGLPIRVVQIAKFGGQSLNSSTKLKNKIAKQWHSSS